MTVPTSYAATIEEMCASPDNTMGFIPGLGYVLASNRCGVDVSFKAVRFGWSVYWAQILVRRDSDIETIEDLEGLTWAYPDTGSTSGFMVPTLMFDEAGVTPGEQVETGGHPQAALAVYRGEADFATTFFSPPLTPDFDWAVGDASGHPGRHHRHLRTERGGQHGCSADRRRPVAGARCSRQCPRRCAGHYPEGEDPDDLAGDPQRHAVVWSGLPGRCADSDRRRSRGLRGLVRRRCRGRRLRLEPSIGNQDFYGWTGIDRATDSEYDSLRTIVELVGYELEG